MFSGMLIASAEVLLDRSPLRLIFFQKLGRQMQWSKENSTMKDPIEGGYIYLAKSLLDSDIWFCSSNTIKVAIYLLLSATFSDNERKNLKRGQCWKTLGIISEDCNISIKAVRCALDRLRSINFIQSQGAHKGARSGQRITICNYSKFQDVHNYGGAGQGHNKGHSKGQAKGQHYNEGNEEKEEIKTKTKPQIHDAAVAAIDWSTCNDEEIKNAFIMFLNERRINKKYVTDNAIKGLFNSLKEFSKTEQLDAINRAIAGSHTALYPKRAYNGGGAAPVQNVKALPTQEEYEEQDDVTQDEDGNDIMPWSKL